MFDRRQVSTDPGGAMTREDRRQRSKEHDALGRFAPASTPPEVRFWLRVDKNGPVPAARPDLGPCWLWCGGFTKPNSTSAGGYGLFSPGGRRHGGKTVLAHRFAYELVHGPLPYREPLDHLCETPACVRPEHVRLASTRENTLRGSTLPARNLAKTHCPRGHPYDTANTYHDTKGRQCRACNRERQRRYYHQR
jgi:hypothetical protein